MITVHEAERLLQAHVRVRAPTAVPLIEAAGRILREDVAADRDYPPFDRVAMDGVAIQIGGLAIQPAYRIAALQRAGEGAVALTDPGACVEIMTGAVLPTGTDTVVRYEDLLLTQGIASINLGAVVKQGQNVHRRGSDRREGEPLLPDGIRLHAPQIAVLASVGKATVRVAPLLRATVVTTGDELVDLHEPVLPHQIRRSNSYAIGAALQSRCTAVLQLHAKDEEAALRTALEQALAESDVVILSGGVSAGKFDLVPQALHSLGVREIFHKIAQKPGKPLWFGATPDGRPVFGLPGNPVSALVCLYRYVIPYLDACLGATPKPRQRLILPERPRQKAGLTLFAPVVRAGSEARLVVENGSGDFASLAESDGFVEITPANLSQKETFGIPFYPWGGA